MNNIILCEGSSDSILLQYYMREAYQWADDPGIQAHKFKYKKQNSRNLKKDSNILTIAPVGGCSKLTEALKEVLTRNNLSKPDLSDAYNKIVIVTDHDEIGTEQSFVQSICHILAAYNVTYTNTIHNNTWIHCKMTNNVGANIDFSVLLMIIPFEENGAMETFLLNAISCADPYDKEIISNCNHFIDNIDPRKKYLSSRRHITKAKFDTYFSVRTPVEQFVERQNILKSVKWEQYTKIQNEFIKLGEL